MIILILMNINDFFLFLIKLVHTHIVVFVFESLRYCPYYYCFVCSNYTNTTVFFYYIIFQNNNTQIRLFHSQKLGFVK